MLARASRVLNHLGDYYVLLRSGESASPEQSENMHNVEQTDTIIYGEMNIKGVSDCPNQRIAGNAGYGV